MSDQAHQHRYGPWWGPVAEPVAAGSPYERRCTCGDVESRAERPPTLYEAALDLLAAWERFGSEPDMPVAREMLPCFFWKRIERLQEAMSSE